MAINLMCTNSDCKYYWEDNCMKNMNEEKIEINSDGKCETFEEGVSEWYNCEYSKDGKCIHPLSNGELECKGNDEEKSKCMRYSEME